MASVLFKPDDAVDTSTFHFVVPTFSGRCVCCNADAQGKTRGYDPSAGQIRARVVQFPVCEACAPHALDPSRTASLVGTFIALGAGTAAMGLLALANHAEPVVGGGLILGGLLTVAAGLSWAFLQSSREKRERRLEGHHARLHFQVLPGMTVLFTENEALVAELLALNPTARRGDSQA